MASTLKRQFTLESSATEETMQEIRRIQKNVVLVGHW